MKKNNIYSLMIMMVMMIFVSSCTAESELDKELEESARYYVKYEVNSSWGGYGVTATQTIKFITEKGADSHSQNVKSSTSMKWEGTYGPFKKGDNVSLSVTNTVMNIHGRIYISREKEPFVIKAKDNGSKKLDLKATIDF